MRERRHFRTDWCYQLISRIAHRAFFLTEDERTRFVDLLRREAAFSGVEVLAYCFMTNHFHILVYVPPPRELSDGPKCPAELRAALGIRSANFFTARYLSPLEKAGLIRISGKADRFSPHKLFELTARGRRLANGQPHH